MDLKKLLLSLALSAPLVLAGCGDDGNGGGGGGTCADNEQIWNLTALALPGQTDVYGFDLDGVNTTEMGEQLPPGCGQVDLAGGIDNVIGQLLGLVGMLAPELDIQAAIDDAITNEDIVIEASILNYEGAGSTGVTLSLRVNGESPAALQNVNADVDAEGNITAELDALPLNVAGIPVETTTIDLNLAITDAIVVIPAPTGSTTVATIGGSVIYDDGTAGSFRSQLEDIIVALGDSVPLPFEDIDALILGLADMSSDGVTCDSLSIGALATFVQEC